MLWAGFRVTGGENGVGNMFLAVVTMLLFANDDALSTRGVICISGRFR